MSPRKPGLVDSEPDTKLISKLQHLNEEFRLGLAVRDSRTVLEIPTFIRGLEYEAWREIRDKISNLHTSPQGRRQLSSALSSYKKWARSQKETINWQDKRDADPRVLGEPQSHIEQLKRVLGISQYSSGQFKKRKSKEISGVNSTEMTPSDDVRYPQFSAEAQGKNLSI